MTTTWLRVLPIPILGFAYAYLLYMATLSLPYDNIQFTNLSTIQDIHRLAKALRSYSTQHFTYVLLLYSSFYIFKQTFCMPGAAALNMIAGSLFGWWGGLLTIVLTGIGISLCYMLSNVFAEPLVTSMLMQPGSRLARLRDQVSSQNADLRYYLICMRLFPITPGWIINICAPVLGVQYRMFVLTGTLGLVPYNLLTTQAGSMLGSIKSVKDIIQPINLVQLAGMAVFALIPVVVRRVTAPAQPPVDSKRE